MKFGSDGQTCSTASMTHFIARSLPTALAMTYTKKQLPKYCHHKSTDRAYVRIKGETFYLGKYGTQASRREYDRVIAEFVTNGRQAFHDPDEILVEQLIIRRCSLL